MTENPFEYSGAADSAPEGTEAEGGAFAPAHLTELRKLALWLTSLAWGVLFYAAGALVLAFVHNYAWAISTAVMTPLALLALKSGEGFRAFAERKGTDPLPLVDAARNLRFVCRLLGVVLFAGIGMILLGLAGMWLVGARGR